MKFLDLNGLTHFWNKIKDWSNSNFFSKRGGEIHPTSGLQYIINGEQLDVSKSGNENSTISVFNVDENGMNAMSIRKTGGTATQVLMADGSVKTLNANNGIAGLDANGNVPLAQLGNLDTTFAEVVTTLPTSNIKKHIYLVADTDGVIQNHYTEYIYNGDVNATYDESKWEKLGDFRATVDLASYVRKSDAVKSISFSSYGSTPIKILKITKADGTTENVSIPKASRGDDGFMDSGDKRKLDGIADNANNYSLPTASATIKGGITLGYSQSGKNYPVVLDNTGKAYVNVPWTDTNTTYGLATSKTDGLMKASDKAKIDSIDTTYAKKIELLEDVTVNPTETTNNEETIELEFTNQEGNPICYTYLPVATIMNCGLMHSHDKNKLDEIDNRATADSAITTAEIDTLFV